MTDTVSILSKPGIKCYAWDNQLCNALFYDTAQGKLEKIRKSTKEEWPGTGESANCICTHHVDRHCTARDRYGHVVTIYCNGNSERCNCGLFRPCSMRIVGEEEDI